MAKDLLATRTKQVLFLRIIVLLTGIYQLVHEPLVGVAIMLALVAISFPGLVTRNYIKALPIEFELILFIMVLLQLIVGETLNFYDYVPYYDKLVHFSLPFFLGFIAAMIAYTMYVTGSLRAKPIPTMIIVIFITLGIGALWEIIEYLSDVFLGTYLQGSLTSPPLVDTMNDLIIDTLGGIFGSLLAVFYIRRESSDKKSRLHSLIQEIAKDFS